MTILLTRLGTTSTLPASFGGQKLWMTSAEVSSISTRRPAGMCSSLAVTTPKSGYSYSHHHWWPVTVTLRVSEPSAWSCTSKMVMTVRNPITARVAAGITVQVSSARALP